jgi:hypothetical protein
MSSTIPAAIMDTVLTSLAPLFLAATDGNLAAARHAAARMLNGHDPVTEEELRLAANIVSFSFQALEALSQAANPEMPLTRVLRLRGGAVSLSREAHKAQRQLQIIQRRRRELARQEPNAMQSKPGLCEQAAPRPESVVAVSESCRAEQAIELIADTKAIAAVAEQTTQTWTQAYRQRQRDKRLARQAAKQQAAAARVAPAAPSPPPTSWSPPEATRI